MDFGPSAIQIAQALSVNPWTEEGLPSDGERLRFAIRLNKAAQDAAAQAPHPSLSEPPAAGSAASPPGPSPRR